MDNFLRNISSVLSAVDLCIEKQQTLPALILLYSCIDTLGSLEGDENEGNRRSFIQWTENYLLKGKELACTAEELYAARCGILHTLSPEARLYRKRKVRRIGYTFERAKTDDLNQALEKMNENSLVVISVNDLKDALELGITEYMVDIENDLERQVKVFKNATQSFAQISDSAINKFLTRNNSLDTSSGVPDITFLVRKTDG